MSEFNKPMGKIRMYPKKRKIGFMEGQPEVYQLCHLRPSVIGNKEITQYAAKAAHVPTSTIELAKDALLDAVTYFCAQGHAVQIPGLGGLSVQFQTKTAESPEDVSLDLVKRKYLRFWAKKEVREQCNLENIHVEIRDVLGILKEEGEENSEERAKKEAT